MAGVYRVGSLDVVEYFNTAREAERFKPYDEDPEEFVRLDAAGECNRLERALGETERCLEHVRRLLAELMEVCETDTAEYRAALAHFTNMPLTPATAADRRGGGSYATG